MTIEPCNPEIISTQDYQQTDIENMFAHADGSVVIVGLDEAYLIRSKP